MDNPYAPFIQHMKDKLAQEGEATVTVTMKGKHLRLLKSLVSSHVLYHPSDVGREVNNILFEALQTL